MTDAPRPGDILSCGEPCPEPDGPIGAYATPPDGRRVCIPHAETEEVATFQAASDYFGYLSADCCHVTTWTGAVLARVTSHTQSRAARRVYIRAVDASGALWHGTGPRESGAYVRLHRSKGHA